MINFFSGIEEATRCAKIRFQCERAANIAARVAPPEAVQTYIAACDVAARNERRYDFMINVLNCAWPWSFVYGIDNGYGIIAMCIFMALWVLFGIHQMSVHKARLYADAIGFACAALCNAATNKGIK